MAWNRYYINDNRNAEERGIRITYSSKCPPHGSIREEWTTVGMTHGTASIFFVEYRKEDDDIDGVWEAYGMKRESSYAFTVNAEEADPEKLFVYALYNDGTLHTGFDIDTTKARAILVFAQPQTITAEQLLDVAQKAENAPRFQGAVEEIVIEGILQGAEDVTCLAFFYR